MTDPSGYGSYAINMTRTQSENYQAKRSTVVQARREDVARLDAQGKLATKAQRMAFALANAVSITTINNDLKAIRAGKSS